MSNETLLAFEHNGATYELDDLGSGEHPSQKGSFAIYCDDEMLAEFTVDYLDQCDDREFLILRAKAEVAQADCLPA